MRRSLVPIVIAVASLAASTRAAGAQQSATQVVTFQVNPISQIAVSGSPAPLTVNTASAGLAPTSATVSGPSYAITTNESGKKIVAALDRAMPPHVDLSIELAAPSGATSAGSVRLSTSGVDAVVGVTTVRQAGLAISYTLTATPDAGIVPQDTRIVTLTIVSGA